MSIEDLPILSRINEKEYAEHSFLKNKGYLRNVALMDKYGVYGGHAPWLILVRAKEHCHEGILLDISHIK